MPAFTISAALLMRLWVDTMFSLEKSPPSQPDSSLERRACREQRMGTRVISCGFTVGFCASVQSDRISSPQVSLTGSLR